MPRIINESTDAYFTLAEICVKLVAIGRQLIKILYDGCCKKKAIDQIRILTC